MSFGRAIGARRQLPGGITGTGGREKLFSARPGQLRGDNRYPISRQQSILAAILGGGTLVVGSPFTVINRRQELSVWLLGDRLWSLRLTGTQGMMYWEGRGGGGGGG